MSGWVAYARAEARNMELSQALGAAIGHMKNVQYALEAGDTKASAIRTLIAGIKIAEAPYEKMAALKAQIEADADLAKSIAPMGESR